MRGHSNAATKKKEVDLLPGVTARLENIVHGETESSIK